MGNNKELFQVLNFSNFIICASMALIAPFFPTYAHEQGLSKTLIGIIMALHPFAGFFGSIKVGKLLTDSNRKNIIIGAMLVQAFCLGLFILTYIIRFYWFISIISLASRVINGIAYSFLITAFYSHIPTLYPDETEQKVALAEAASALGYMLGPMIGSILYAIGGFTFPFFTFILLSIACAYYINKSEFITQNGKQEIEMIGLGETVVQKEEEPLGYFEAIKHYEIVVNAFMCIMVTTSITINFPLMAQYFLDFYQIKETTVGFYMGLQPMCYTISTIGMGRLSKPHKPTYMLGFQFLLGLSLFFFGPDKLFTGLERNLVISCISLIVSGCSQAFPLIYSLPQINESMIKLFPHKKEQCINMASAIFSASISFGEFSGPFIGGVLGNYFELDRISSITGLLSLTLCISYLPFYCKHRGYKGYDYIQKLLS